MAAARVRVWISVSAFLSGFVYLILAMLTPLKRFDEGLVVVAAERILHGAIPYRDFAAYYAPGQFYTLAAVFHIFGSSILTERIWDTVVRFSLCVLVFFIARTLVPGRASYLSYFIMVLFFGWCSFFGYPVVPSMLCALAAILLLIRAWPENRPRSSFLAGFAAGLSVFYRQDVGAYALASGAIALLIAGFAGAQNAANWRAGVIEKLRPLVWFGLGACLLLVPLLFYFLAKIPLGVLYADFMKLPRLQLKFRFLPLPPVIPSGKDFLWGMTLGRAWFLFYVPVAVFVASSVNLLRRASGRSADPGGRRRQFAELLLTVFGSLLLVTTVTRADPIHCLAPTIPACILIVPLLLEWPRRRAWGTLLLAICLVVLAVPYVASPVFRWGLGLKVFGPWGRTSSLPRARFFHVRADQEAAVRFIQQHVPQGQAIFVGDIQNRRISGNDVIFYFLAERRPGTRYEEFEPGIVTTAAVQREMVRELQENHVGWVVLVSEFEVKLPIGSPSEQGATVLDDFLHGQYREVVKFGRYSVLRKREGSNRASTSTALTRAGANPSTPWARAPDALPCRSSVYQLAAFSFLHIS